MAIYLMSNKVINIKFGPSWGRIWLWSVCVLGFIGRFQRLGYIAYLVVE